MRCTRCDGLAVPQAVGIHPDGWVVFGWCLGCLASTGCRLVEIPETGPTGLKLDFKTDESAGLAGAQRPLATPAGDPSRWVIALVSFSMISWGMILLVAGLFSGSWPLAGAGSPDHLTSPMLVGGTATALLGLGLLVLASRRDWLPDTSVLVFLSWLSFVGGLGILGYAVFDYQPSRNVPILLGAGTAVLISIVARLLERSQRDKMRGVVRSTSSQPAAARSQAGEMNRLN